MESDIDLLSYCRLLLKKKKTVLVFVILAAIVGIGYIVLTPKSYRAVVFAMLPSDISNQTFASSIISQVVGAGGVGSSTIQIVKLLVESRSFAERMSVRHDLRKVYFKHLWDERSNTWKSGLSNIPTMKEAASLFRQQLKFEADMTNNSFKLIIESVDRDSVPKLANAAMDELRLWIDERAFTDAKRNRIFLGNQIIKNRKEILDIGKDVAAYYKGNQVSATLGIVEVPLALSDGDSFPQAPSLGKTEDIDMEIEFFEVQKAEAEASPASTVKDVPQQVYFNYVLQKQIILNNLHGLLSQKYELARIDEAKNGLAIEVIDWARLPSSHFKPRKRFVLGLSILLGLMIGVFYVFVEEYIHMVKQKGREQII